MIEVHLFIDTCSRLTLLCMIYCMCGHWQLLGRERVSRESATSLHSSGVLKSMEKCLKSLRTTSSVVPVP